MTTFITPKRKAKDRHPPVNTICFFVLWIAAHAIAFLIPAIFYISFQFVGASLVITALSIVIAGSLIMITQQFLLRLHTGFALDGWSRYGFIALMLGAGISLVTPSFSTTCLGDCPTWWYHLIDGVLYFGLPALVLCTPALMHAYLLRHTSNHSWRYPLTMLIFAVTLALIAYTTSATIGALYWGTALGAVVSGAFLIWFFRQVTPSSTSYKYLLASQNA